eukprot:scaffold160839_cov36-Tisochrysis_lutea.AAC.6
MVTVTRLPPRTSEPCTIIPGRHSEASDSPKFSRKMAAARCIPNGPLKLGPAARAESAPRS